MKIKAKISSGNDNTRVSALQRLSKPNSTNNNNVHQRLSAPTTSTITDARQLLSSRNKPVFDARQLLSRQTSKTMETSLIIRRDIQPEEETAKTIVLQKPVNSQFTVRTLDRSANKEKKSLFSTEPISFTKTITNTSKDRPALKAASSDQKILISFDNDEYRKRARSPSPIPPPVVKRISNPSSTSRLSIRHDSDEPPKKQQNSSTISKDLFKKSVTNTQSKPTNNDTTTILITNLQSTVTEDDIMELFGEIGSINEIKTLSHGCVQIVYTNEEDAHRAVTNYHNRLLDGQLMYVSLQQPSYVTKSSKNSSTLSTNKEDDSSKKYSIDPAFFRQALFNTTSTNENPVQFQVKL